MSAFIPGVRLSQTFFRDAVQPVLARLFPDLAYSAALLGTGSEVQGFDTPMSSDHHWGPRVMLFLEPPDLERTGPEIHERLRHELPREHLGYPTNFSPPQRDRSRLMQAIESGPVEHRVELWTVPAFLEDRLGIDRYSDLDAVDWLTFTDQALREVTGGEVFHDGLDELEPMREAFHYYAHDVWLYLLSAQWARVGQLEPFVGRCGLVGDEAGSAVIAASMVRDVMRLGFLLERQYAPYPKWFGTAFARLSCGPELLPSLEGALHASEWQGRELHLSRAYGVVARMHNELNITDPLPTQVSSFHDRPFLVIHGEDFAEATRNVITDEQVRALPPFVGSIEQFVDSTDVLTSSARRRALRRIYEAR